MSSRANVDPNYMIPNYFENPVLRPYLANVRNWQCYIRFLGLPDRRDNPDILIDRLFVTPLLVRRYVSPDENPKSWIGDAETLLDALAENSPLVILGDPGIGKSTFLNYVAWLLSRPAENSLIDRMGWRLPLPMVLRELPVRGVTDFDGLLEAFLGREMSAPLREDGGRYLRQALADGQAFLLLDGIDELGDREARENLRSAVVDGMARFPDCRWLLTSRIVGYDEAPFDSAHSQRDEMPFPEEPDGEPRDTILRRRPRGLLSGARLSGFLSVRPESRGGQIPVRYIAPFDDRRIMAFARNWYVRREASASRANANADHLVRAVHADESILRLARVPNLLTMMALIHRIEATLPHGRALLYERIAEAYLESIDKFRGIESSPHDLPRKKGWLARVGFEMQRLRMAEDETPLTNILMDATTVREWLSEEMESSDAVRDTPSAEEFLKIVGRRSGLFLPRGEGLYAFVHLSFQEYFAAVALKREVTRLRWAKGHASRLGFRCTTLAGWAGESLWRETFAFLFELLASEEDDDWHADLLDCVFGEHFSRLDGSESNEVSLNLGHLLARLVVNPRSGLSPSKSDAAIARCVKAQMRLQAHCKPEGMPSSIFADLIRDDTQLNVRVFTQIGVQIEIEEPGNREIDLSSSLVSDLAPIAKLTALKSLDLGGTQVSNVGPLARLTALRSLNLMYTPVSDISPLASLVTLDTLLLIDTQVSNINPLAELTSLERLSLAFTQVSDIGPLASLTALEWLDLLDTQVSNIGPLAKLTGLERLDLTFTQVSDIGPLANLRGLERLDLAFTQISDLAPVANLSALEHLDFTETQVSDIGPLANLSTLKSVHLMATQVSDIGPLANLSALRRIDLRDTPVSVDVVEELRARRPELHIEFKG